MTVPDDRRFDPATDTDLLADTDHSDTGTGTTETDTSAADGVAGDRTGAEPLVAQDAAVDLRARWDVIQQGFVDDPRNAVSEADHLVDDLLARLSETFERQHRDLENQWSDGEPSTEDLRTALQRYRAFFQRLLTI